MAKGLEMIPKVESGASGVMSSDSGKLRDLQKKADMIISPQPFPYSPLKNAQKLNEIGERLAGEYGVAYLVSDFKKRNGYKRSTELSKIYGLYRQDYCGCIYSKNQREREKKLREEEESSVKS
mgnify:CR=1 FL=1